MGYVGRNTSLFLSMEIYNFIYLFQQLEQLAKLKGKDSVTAEELLKKQIKEHEDALNRTKESLAKLKK